jgi:hypothetical protein
MVNIEIIVNKEETTSVETERWWNIAALKQVKTPTTLNDVIVYKLFSAPKLED